LRYYYSIDSKALSKTCH